MAQAVAAAATPEALANVDIATSTESYLRKRKTEAEHVPPEDAASRQLGGIGPGAMAEKIHNESMEPAITSLWAAAEKALGRKRRHGFRLALTKLGEFDEVREELVHVGKLVAEFLDDVDAVEEHRKQNEAEGARAT